MLLSSDGQGPGDRDEPHFFLRCVLSSDGQAPGDRDEPHSFFEDVYCHLMDKHQMTVINPIFLRCVLSSDGQGPGDPMSEPMPTLTAMEKTAKHKGRAYSCIRCSRTGTELGSITCKCNRLQLQLL